MKLTVLGSGTSSGVPIVGCECGVCRSVNPKNKRLRSSCLFEVAGKVILIDTSPDLREQALRYGIDRVDAVLYTHIHADHVHGIDEMRVYNAYQQAAIPAFGGEKTMAHLTAHFAYIFRPTSLYPSLVPRLEPHVVSGLFDCLGVPVQMVPCHHGPGYMTQNYRIGDIAWLTDTNGIPEDSFELLLGLDVLFLDGLRPHPHPTHFHLEESLAAAARIGAKKTYLIHLTHDYDHDVVNKTLPEGVELAYDGLVVKGGGA
jgi:phosphoribosyl 1,2-cyclic phosphate phosphodiesterase